MLRSFWSNGGYCRTAKVKLFIMNRLNFLLAVFVVTIVTLEISSCTKENLNIELNENVNLALNGFNSTGSCLNETEIDSFIYYANAFTNILNSNPNLSLIQDSLQLVFVSSNISFNSFKDYCIWVENTFSIPRDITTKFGYYSNKILPDLQQENLRNHPIADRYYFLIENGCINSNIDFIGFYSNLRKGCGFWSVFGNTVGLAASVAGAVVVETWTLGVGTAAAISLGVSAYSYGSAVTECF